MTGAEDCPSCGEWIGADASWCLHCGSAVASTASGGEEDAGEVGHADDERVDGDSDGDARSGGVRDGRAADRDRPSVGRLEVALHFVNRYEWLRGAFAIAVLAAMLAAVFQFHGPRWRSGAVSAAAMLVWLYAISRNGTKRILVVAGYGTAGLLVLARASGVIPEPLASAPTRAARLAFDGPTLVVVAGLIVGAQLLSTLVVQPPDPYGVAEDPD